MREERSGKQKMDGARTSSIHLLFSLGTPLWILLFFSSCSPHTVRIFDTPETPIPVSYSATHLIRAELREGGEPSQDLAKPWWFAFEDEQLSLLIDRAFQNNLTLQAAWARLRQAREGVVILGAERFPQLTVGAGGSRTRSEIDDTESVEIFRGVGADIQNDFFLRNGLSFEVDLWRRIASQREAGAFRAVATRADVENTALLLAGSIAESYFEAQRQRALVNLLEEQIKTSSDLLELVELRFAVGRSSAQDVYQQREQVASLQSELPTVRNGYVRVVNRLAVLLGVPPGQLSELELLGELQELPPFPEIVTPVDLLQTRPDLRAARAQLQVAEYDLAAAFAERFPRLQLGFDYDFRTADLSDLFTTKVGSLSGNFLIPLIDGGRLRAVVRREQGAVSQFQSEFGQSFLQALEEVENAIAGEYFQRELLVRLKTQRELSAAALRVARARYVNGLSDYIDVILAIQRTQVLERRVISERAGLLIARTQLYRSMGGPWLENLTEEGFTEEHT